MKKVEKVTFKRQTTQSTITKMFFFLVYGHSFFYFYLGFFRFCSFVWILLFIELSIFQYFCMHFDYFCFRFFSIFCFCSFLLVFYHLSYWMLFVCCLQCLCCLNIFVLFIGVVDDHGTNNNNRLYVCIWFLSNFINFCVFLYLVTFFFMLNECQRYSYYAAMLFLKQNA